MFEIELSKGDAITKWFKNGTEVELSDRVQTKIDGKKQRLEIFNVSTTDAGEYSCTIGNEKCAANLAVEEAKVNFEAKLPETTTASVGQEVQITVQLSSETEAVQWLKYVFIWLRILYVFRLEIILPSVKIIIHS